MHSLQNKKFRKSFEKLDHGSHICCIYSGEEKLTALASFMEIGLERNEKCLYIFDDRDKENIIGKFRDEGIDIDEALNSGQFEFLTKRESYLTDGYFEPEKMFQLLSKAKEEALSQGYTGLRGTGEMTWFFSNTPGVERLMEYESKLNEFLQGQEMVILCQYNENKFSPEILLDVIYTHPKVIVNDYLYENHYYMPIDVFATVVKREVDEDYYQKIKNNLVEEAQLTGIERKIEGEEETLHSLLQTLEKIEKSNY